MESNRRRDRSLDVIRCLAIVSVICEHTSSAILHDGILKLVLEIFGSIGVPLFVGLTGFLMLGRDYSKEYLARFLRRNLLPLFVALELWNVIWFGISHIIGTPISKLSFVRVALFIGPSGTGFWFLPMILGVYLGLPLVTFLLRGFEESKNSGWRFYTIIIVSCFIFFGTIVPTLAQLLQAIAPQYAIESTLNMNIFGADVWGNSVWMLYLVVGYSIKKGYWNKIRSSILLIVFLASCFLLYLYHDFLMKNGMAWDPSYSNVFLVILTSTLFAIMYRHCEFEHLGKTAADCISAVSHYSFAMYMLHYWILEVCLLFVAYIGHRTIYFVFSSIICFLVSLLVGRLLALIPPARKWLLLIK